MYRDKLFIIFIALDIISLIFLILSFNALIIKIPALMNIFDVNLIGSWQYWLLIVSFILFIYLFYLAYSDINDISEFKKMLASNSKRIFMENLPQLEKISKKFKGDYITKLADAKHKWGIRR
ncbi:MAG: DUF3198 domain-containing protein [Ferroplasma sp.]